MVPHFYGSSAYIGLFDLPRTNVSGHHGRTGTTRRGSDGKETPLYFHKSFTFFWTQFVISIRYLNSRTFILSDSIEILKSNILKFPRTLFLTGISFLKKHSGIFFLSLLHRHSYICLLFDSHFIGSK
jgi:hypothetical protein